MRLRQIQIANFQQFKDVRLDLTYPEDTATRNFLKFIGANLPELFVERKRCIDRLIGLREEFGEDLAAFLNVFRKDRRQLSFITALATELDLERELLAIARDSFEP